MKSKTILMILSLAIICFFAGCKEKGPAEKAGEQIDKSFDKVQDKAEEAGKDIKKSVSE